MSGIYSITNTINGKRYIGQTKQLFKIRWNQHKALLRKNKHFNPHLQRAWNLFGESSFIFEILEETTELNARERYWILFYKSSESAYGYNDKEGGSVESLSPEARKRLSEKLKGRIPWNKGKKGLQKQSLESNRKRSETLRKRAESMSEEDRKQHYGKHLIGKKSKIIGIKRSEDTKRKISEGQKGRMYVHLGSVNKRIRPEDLNKYLDMGYKIGGKKNEKD